MQKRLKELIDELLSVYWEIKEIMPNLHDLILDACIYYDEREEDKDMMVDNLVELCYYLSRKQRRHEILFYKFKRTGY